MRENGKIKILLKVLVISMALVMCIVVGFLFFRVLDFSAILDIAEEQNVADDMKKEDMDFVDYEEINRECIIVEEKNIEMKNEEEGTAIISVSIPNYEQLYKKALKAENSDEYLLNALEKKEFSTVEYEEEVRVTVEDGETVVHSEEMVKQLLEEELIKAINALTEGVDYEENN